MRLTSPSRRAAGLLAVTTIGLSTAVLSTTGIASAGQVTTTTTFSTDAGAATDEKGITTLFTDGDCTITWDLVGAAGGTGYTGADTSAPTAGGKGGHYAATTTSTNGAAFSLYAGAAGENGDPAGNGAGDGGTNGAPWTSDGLDGFSQVDADPANAATNVFGGGGGAASVVTAFDGSPLLGAFGGDGGLSDGTAGIGGLDGTNANETAVTGTDGTPSGEGNGVISGSMTCTVTETDPVLPPVDDEDEAYVTGAPQLNWLYGVENGLDFQLYRTTVASDDPITGVEYRLDSGSWTAIEVENTDDYQFSGTITGLATATKYSVSFRFTTTKGSTEASQVLTESTAVPGPQNVTAVAGASSIKVNWAAAPDMNGVAGYVAIAAPDGDQSSGREVSCQPADALGTSCVLPAVPGLVYGVSVHTLDAEGYPIGRSDWVLSGTVSAPVISASVPKADGTLVSDAKDGKVVAGSTVTISGDGFLPDSTTSMVVYSTPVDLGSVVVLADGTFTAPVTLPKDLTNGVHHLVASGVDVNGNPRNLVIEITVTGGTAVLAYTGFSALPFIGGGVLALAAGAGLLVASRRRAA